MEHHNYVEEKCEERKMRESVLKRKRESELDRESKILSSLYLFSITPCRMMNSVQA